MLTQRRLEPASAGFSIRHLSLLTGGPRGRYADRGNRPEVRCDVTTRRAMKGVLDGFLGTYVSRYSEYDGYWLFGFLVSELQNLRVDLLSDEVRPADDTPEAVAVALARLKFRDQVAKAGLSFGSIRAAELEIARQLGTRKGFVSGSARDGYSVLFEATATMDNGRVYKRERSVFISPHDATIERRSARAGG
jgi:hypothetical protein